MRRRILVVVAAAIMALAVMNVASAAVPSNVSIRYNTGTQLFHGVVSSSDAECEAGRVVKVFKETAGGPSLQGKAMSKSNGHWKLEVMHASGHYFAVAPKEKVMHTTCGKAKSSTIDVM